MKVLLLHPESAPWDRAWSRERWDLIVDLGYASRSTYAEWTSAFQTRVFSLHEYVSGTESYRWVNQLFEVGRGRLLDRAGLDWWELLAMESYQDLHVLYLCRRLRAEISANELEFAAPRPHRLVRIVEQVFDQRVRYFGDGADSPIRRAIKSLRSARNLRLAQVVEVAFDKWDPGYQVRRHWSAKSRLQLTDSAILLPSAYSNVTRSVLAYASQLPERKFVLATTRRSAMPGQLPPNVAMTSLAAYANPGKVSLEEISELRRGWHAFIGSMSAEHPEIQQSFKAGLWDYFPAHLAQGVHLREAWSQLLNSEPMAGVLCGDDLNYHTRLPLILAQRAGLKALYCSHGALDGGFLFKKPFANEYLVKGAMESDYLRRVANVPAAQILVAAPGENSGSRQSDRRPDAIVFFSQPFEVLNGRTDSIYREILPRLCWVAERTGHKVVVKLHPFESSRSRQKLVMSVLAGKAHGNVEVVDGTVPEEVMSRAWCGITVDSSVAVECALRKIPFFLCGWLDFTGMEYLQQYARFGVAQVLKSAEEIEKIPEMVDECRLHPANLDQLWHPAEPSQLDDVMFGMQPAGVDRCAS